MLNQKVAFATLIHHILTRYFIELSFKGTNYHGWQIQKNAPSVQAILNSSLEIILKEKVITTGAGRTDTGVHAKYFIAHFNSWHANLHLKKTLVNQLNKILPRDIAVTMIIKMPDNAHARFDAISRTYQYYVTCLKNPFQLDYAWYLKAKPDLSLMNKAADILLSKNDFTSFSKLHSNSKTNLCRLTKAIWEERNDLMVFTIQADRFLRNMVRAIVGTLVDAGRGKTSLEKYHAIIESKNRSNAGQSVPAHGLFLVDIEYPEHYGLKRDLQD